jgi:hypothetical protein
MPGQPRDHKNDTPLLDAALARLRKRQQSLEDLRALQDQGWFWSETTANLLVSPCDREINAWYDPFNCELLFSPKMVEMIEELLREECDGPFD